MKRSKKNLDFGDFLKKRGNEGNKLDKGSDDLRDLKVSAKKFTSIHDFIDHSEHMAAMNKEIKKQSKNRQDAITLSTIHRAKGLEYKIVYLIGTVDGSIPHDYALESLREGDSGHLRKNATTICSYNTSNGQALLIRSAASSGKKRPCITIFSSPLRH